MAKLKTTDVSRSCIHLRKDKLPFETASVLNQKEQLKLSFSEPHLNNHFLRTQIRFSVVGLVLSKNSSVPCSQARLVLE